MIGRETTRGRQMPWCFFRVCLLPKAALKARERSAGTSEKGCIRGKHLPRAHGVGPRSLIAPGPGRLPDRAPMPTSLPTTKNHRLEKEKSMTHVYLSHKVVESLTSLPCLSRNTFPTHSDRHRVFSGSDNGREVIAWSKTTKTPYSSSERELFGWLWSVNS